jgi:ATP-dependent DNA helicase RecQ
MQRRILDSLGVADARVFVRDVDRPNISLLRWEAASSKRFMLVEQICLTPIPNGGKVMIFVPTRKVGESLRQYLAHAGLDIPFYHSQLGTAWEREQLVKRFVGESRPAVDRIICTNAFGMGLDVPNVRIVVHWQHPSSVEDYLQEFGRAGRDGRPSVAVVFYSKHSETDGSRDRGLLRFMAEKSVQKVSVDRQGALDHRLKQIERMSEIVLHTGCFRAALLGYFSAAKKTARRSFSTWLLEWLFAERTGIQRQTACCEFCARTLIDARGRLGFIQAALNSRLK